jgi:hypothetical protein
VTQNLAEALKELRLPDRGTKIWVDALCINQSDNLERKVQVQSMSQAYENAMRVVAWLGPHENNSAAAFGILKRVESFDFSYWIPALISDDRLDDAMHAFPPLMSRDYWFRAWIVQEIAFASELWIRCGSDEVPYSIFVNIRHFLSGVFSATFEPRPTRALRSYDNARTQRSNSPTYDKTLLEPGSARIAQSSSPLNLLNFLLESHCADRRDSIFAFYNLFSSNLQGKIEIDYSTPPEKVLINAVRAIIEATQNLDIIAIKGRQSRPKRGEAWQRDMPSWCPYFNTSFKSHSIAPHDTADDTEHHFENDSIDHTANGTLLSAAKVSVTFLDNNRILKARGFTIGVISSTLPRESRQIDQFQPLNNDDDVRNQMTYLKNCLHFGYSLTCKDDDSSKRSSQQWLQGEAVLKNSSANSL